MKRKRLEATLLNDSGLAPDGGEWSLSFDELTAHGRRYYSRKGRAAVRVVECGPDEVVVPRAAAAVVRAAKRLVNSCGYGDRYGDHAGLIRAVERMQKGRKK